MHDYLKIMRRVYPEVGAAVSTDLVDFGGATGVVAVMNFGGPIDVMRMGITIDNAEALDVGAGFTIKLQKYLVPGLATNAVDLGSISRTADVAAGGVVYNNFDSLPATQTAEDDTVRNVAPRTVFDTTSLDSEPGNFRVLPGEQLVWNLTDAADTTGKGQVWIEYVERPFAGSDIADAIKVQS